MKTTTQTATVKEMRTLCKRCQEAKSTAETQANITSNNVIQCSDKLALTIKHATDAANSWQNVHHLTAAAHSAANRAESHADDAATYATTAKICLLINILASAIFIILTLTIKH